MADTRQSLLNLYKKTGTDQPTNILERAQEYLAVNHPDLQAMLGAILGAAGGVRAPMNTAYPLRYGINGKTFDVRNRGFGSNRFIRGMSGQQALERINNVNIPNFSNPVRFNHPSAAPDAPNQYSSYIQEPFIPREPLPQDNTNPATGANVNSRPTYNPSAFSNELFPDLNDVSFQSANVSAPDPSRLAFWARNYNNSRFNQTFIPGSSGPRPSIFPPMRPQSFDPNLEVLLDSLNRRAGIETLTPANRTPEESYNLALINQILGRKK